MSRKSLETFTISDWMAAQRELSASSFRDLKQTARVLGVRIPLPVVARNSDPVVQFEFDPSAMAREVRISDSAALNKFKKDLVEWSDHLMSDLRSRVSALGLVSGRRSFDRLVDSFQSYIKYDDQYHVEPVKIGFRFARHGVHLHYGAGRGYGGRQGSRWIDRLGYYHETNPESLGKAGSGSRPPRDWFNPVLDWHLKELADIAAAYCGDMIVNSDHFYLGI